MRNLRETSFKAHLFGSISPQVCELVWQGDFGKGQPTGSGVWSDPGANPCVLYAVPSTTAPTGGLGIPAPQWKLGMTINGDTGSEFVFCKLVLGATTDLLPGQAYQYDENFTATLLTTANSVLNYEFGVCNVWAPQAVAGTYYIWVQRAGHCAVQAAAASIATGQAETTATAGVLKFLASASHTAGTKSTQGLTAFGASSSITFTGTTVSGSPYITAVASGNAASVLADLQVGMVFTGTGAPANSIIAAITRTGNTWQITIGTNTAGSYSTLQNATASNSAVTFTVTSHVAANVYWPTLLTQN
jgi:hypothetical protein